MKRNLTKLVTTSERMRAMSVTSSAAASGVSSFLAKRSFAMSLVASALLLLTSCSAEPDKSNLYVFTGQMIEDYLTENEDFSSFNYILTRAGYDKHLSTYGQYTCFAPTNDAIAWYIDSLYNDEENVLFVHNGMTENSLEGLTDSLCKDIAQFHLCNLPYELVDLAEEGKTITPMLSRVITCGTDTDVESSTYGSTTLNNTAVVVEGDIECENGVVHVVNNVIPRNNRLVGVALQKDGRFDIFYEAMEKCGLAELLNSATDASKPSYTEPRTHADYEKITDPERKVMYTIFAEPDEVMQANGINSVDDLFEYAKSIYEHSADAGSGWYDYYRNNNAQVSTGTDYTDSLNVLNMFLRYHILAYGIQSDMFVKNWNIEKDYGWTGDGTDYYETMLPMTLIKIWFLYSGKTYHINRYESLASLTNMTDAAGDITLYTKGTIHTIQSEGLKIDNTDFVSPLNGYIYPISGMLVYDESVPNNVLNERMRMDTYTFEPELMTNGWRALETTEFASKYNTSKSRPSFPEEFFDNIHVYNGTSTILGVNMHSTSNSFLNFYGDSFRGYGNPCDLAFRLPPVPDGDYELRIDVTLGNADRWGMYQYYLSEDGYSTANMVPLDIPIDFRMDADDPRIGYSDCTEEEDEGLATDKAMRARGWMRAAASYRKETNTSMNARISGYSVRRIIVRQHFEQKPYWFRVKGVRGENECTFQFDYAEFCPTDIVDNGMYIEDVY